MRFTPDGAHSSTSITSTSISVIGAVIAGTWQALLFAKVADPVQMANAFRLAIEAGRAGFEAGLMGPRDFASPSTPVVGTPFWHAVS